MEDIFERALTTGADGMVGSYVDFGTRTNHRMLDVTDFKQTIEAISKSRPKLILHLAAETDVDRCERDPQHAFLVNAIGTYNVAFAAKHVEALLIYVSTSAVFDGFKTDPYTEDDTPNPRSIYGNSKYAGELIVQSMGSPYIIARACNMFGGGPKRDQKFVANIIKQIGNTKIDAVTDQIGSPTFGKDLIGGIIRLIRENKRGIFHLSNTGSCSRYECASHIIKTLGCSLSLYKAKMKDFPSRTPRGINESMISLKINFMRPWREAISEYLKEEWNG